MTIVPVPSALEATIDETVGARLDALAPDFAALWDPWSGPADQLALKAHAVGLAVWDESWSEDVKRRAIHDWPKIAAILGTEAALRWAADIMGAQVIDVQTPPGGFVLDGSDSQWQAFAASLPELRLYDEREAADRRLPPTDPEAETYFILTGDGGEGLPLASDSLRRWRATKVENGIETEIHVDIRPDPRPWRDGLIAVFSLPISPSGRMALGKATGCLDRMDGLSIGIAFDPASRVPAGLAIVGAGAGLSYVQPERLAVDVTGDRLALGVHVGALDRDDPGRQCWRWRLMREEVLSVPMATPLGPRSRFSQGTFTVSIQVELREPTTGFALGKSPLGAVPTEDAPSSARLHRLCDALATVKSGRDQVYVDINPPLKNPFDGLDGLGTLQLR